MRFYPPDPDEETEREVYYDEAEEWDDETLDNEVYEDVIWNL